MGERYTIEEFLGCGCEGEVYQIRKLDIGILRTTKFYFPYRNPKPRFSVEHARMLNALHHCHIDLQYHHFQVIKIHKNKMTAWILGRDESKPLEK